MNEENWSVGMGIDVAEPPVIIIDLDEGEPWHYCAIGIRGLWVRGGIHFSTDRYTFWFDDIQMLHDRIGSWVLSLPELNGEHVRFLRKELSLTANEFSGEDFCATELQSWENGGERVDGAEEKARAEYSNWLSQRSELFQRVA